MTATKIFKALVFCIGNLFFHPVQSREEPSYFPTIPFAFKVYMNEMILAVIKNPIDLNKTAKYSLLVLVTPYQ